MAEKSFNVTSGKLDVSTKADSTKPDPRPQAKAEQPGAQAAEIPKTEPGPSVVPGQSGAKDRGNPVPGTPPHAAGVDSGVPQEHDRVPVTAASETEPAVKVKPDEVIVPADPDAKVPLQETQRRQEVHQQFSRIDSVSKQLEASIIRMMELMESRLPGRMGPYHPKAAAQTSSVFAGELDALAGRLELLNTRIQDISNHIDLT
jgi:hypothetical protein